MVVLVGVDVEVMVCVVVLVVDVVKVEEDGFAEGVNGEVDCDVGRLVLGVDFLVVAVFCVVAADVETVAGDVDADVPIDVNAAVTGEVDCKFVEARDGNG